MSSSLNSIMVDEDDNERNSATPLLDQPPSFQTQPDLVNVEVDQVAPAAPVPYVGKDPRFYFDIEAMSRQPPRPEPRPNDLPEGVERPKGIGCIVDVAIFLDGRRNIDDLEIPLTYPFDKTYPIVWPNHVIPIHCHLCNHNTTTHIETFLTSCGWFWVLLSFITGLWCFACLFCFCPATNTTYHYCKMCAKHIGLRDNCGSACHNKQPMYEKRPFRKLTKKQEREIQHQIDFYNKHAVAEKAEKLA